MVLFVKNGNFRTLEHVQIFFFDVTAYDANFKIFCAEFIEVLLKGFVDVFVLFEVPHVPA